MLLPPNVGPVTTRPGARLHLDVLGRAHCGAGTGRILAPSAPLDETHRGRLCRRCVRRVRQLLLDGIREAMSRRDTIAARCLPVLNRLYDAMRGAAQVVAERRLSANVATTMAGAPVLSGLGRIAAAHRAALAADRVEFATGQLALFAA